MKIPASFVRPYDNPDELPRRPPNLVLLERANDWVRQDMHERLRAAAAQLCVNGYIESTEFARIDSELQKDVAAALAARAHKP